MATTAFLIDLGNTRLKWACYQNMQITSTGGYTYDIDQFAEACSREWGEIPTPSKVCVSSDVETDLSNALTQWIGAHWGVQVQIISPKSHAHGVKNAYKNPLQLGSDRWAALVAVKNNIKQAAIIIDCGTAITIDAITGSGVHLGGMILPGVQLMRDSLLKGTHKIETTTLANVITYENDNKKMPLASLTNNTLDGIKSGVLTAIIAFINSAVDHAKSTLSKSAVTLTTTTLSSVSQQNHIPIQSIITGGDAEILLPLLDKSFMHRPQLVLEGLAILMEKTK